MFCLAQKVEKSFFAKTAKGEDVYSYKVSIEGGIILKALSFGGIITELHVKDKFGKYADITAGYEKLSDYERPNPYFGALIGRCGNRIAKGKFSLNGKDYNLAVNNGPNALHGGIKGFDKHIWNVIEVVGSDFAGLIFTRTSPDGEEGFPGNLQVEVKYIITKQNELQIEYRAVTDKPTPVNLTQHIYFNLAASGDILGHELTLNSKYFTPVDETLIPTGEILKVAGTPFDFSAPHKIGERINDTANQQIKFGGGYDHNFIIDKPLGKFALVGTFYEATSGRLMEVFSTEPAVQFYSGNFLDSKDIGKGGVAYKYRSFFAFETQHYPDSPNHAHFPSIILKPSQDYYSKTVYKFSAK